MTATSNQYSTVSCSFRFQSYYYIMYHHWTYQFWKFNISVEIWGKIDSLNNICQICWFIKLPGKTAQNTPIDNMCNIFWHFHHRSHYQDQGEVHLFQPENNWREILVIHLKCWTLCGRRTFSKLKILAK
jgi:hypothetical protein